MRNSEEYTPGQNPFDRFIQDGVTPEQALPSMRERIRRAQETATEQRRLTREAAAEVATPEVVAVPQEAPRNVPTSKHSLQIEPLWTRRHTWGAILTLLWMIGSLAAFRGHVIGGAFVSLIWGCLCLFAFNAPAWFGGALASNSRRGTRGTAV